MEKATVEAVDRLMTSEECEIINQAGEEFRRDCTTRRASIRSRREAEVRRTHQIHRLRQILWTVFFWTVAFVLSVITAHTCRMPTDTILSLNCAASMVAGIVIGRLVGKMGK